MPVVSGNFWLVYQRREQRTAHMHRSTAMAPGEACPLQLVNRLGSGMKIDLVCNMILRFDIA